MSTGRYRTWIRAYARHRYAILLCSLLATIALGPLLRHLEFGDRIVEWLLGASLLVAVLPEFGERRWAVLILLVLLAVPLRFGAAMLGLREVSSFGLVSWTLLAMLAGWRALNHALRATRVDSEHLCAGLSVYMLAGLFWGVAYVSVEQILPGSFTLGGAPLMGEFSLADGIYYSFVTLATLGYGDISPLGPIARGLAIFEAVFGQLYLAVLVAGLVSQRIVSRAEGRNSAERDSKERGSQERGSQERDTT